MPPSYMPKTRRGEGSPVWSSHRKASAQPSSPSNRIPHAYRLRLPSPSTRLSTLPPYTIISTCPSRYPVYYVHYSSETTKNRIISSYTTYINARAINLIIHGSDPCFQDRQTTSNDPLPLNVYMTSICNQCANPIIKNNRSKSPELLLDPPLNPISKYPTQSAGGVIVQLKMPGNLLLV